MKTNFDSTFGHYICDRHIFQLKYKTNIDGDLLLNVTFLELYEMQNSN